MTAATIPMPSARTKKPWQPKDRDRLIFRWVRFEGLTQQWVARELNMHQTTVSRVLQRYERWIARGGPASEGALSREELLRYHRWLTFERNEHIIASSLRLADELTRPFDTSTSTTTHPAAHPSYETHVRTENKVIDRSGTPCRYLRLAFRVGEAQLKLLEQDELPPLDPLTEDDLDPTLDEELDRAIPTLTSLDPKNRNPNPDLNPAPNPDLHPAPNPDPSVVEGSPDPSTSPTESLPNPQDNAITTIKLSPSAPHVHKTHIAERDLTRSRANTFAHESPSQDFSSTAYPPFDREADRRSSSMSAPAAH